MNCGIVEGLERGIVLLDGGTGSALIACGLESGASTALWNLEHPERVRAVHEGFLRAGCDVVHSNSFGANAAALARNGLSDQLFELNHAAARIARAATQAVGHGLVAGNMGPTGLCRPPHGKARLSDLQGAFLEQARALAEADVDYFSLETFSDLEEARLAIRAIRAVSELPITAALTFDCKRGPFLTLMGERAHDVFAALEQEGVCAVGANCSTGSAEMLANAPELLAAASLPLILKPNAGLPDVVDGRVEYAQAPAEFAAQVAAMASLGARAVGGCCGTDPAFISALRAALDRQAPV